MRHQVTTGCPYRTQRYCVFTNILRVETLNTVTSNYRNMTREFSLDRRSYLKAVGTAGATTAVAGCLDDDENVINPGTASGFPPFEFTQGGELVGFDIDLAEAVIERAGYEVGEWTDIEFDSLIPSLVEGNIDMAAAAMTITEERQGTIAFSSPYYEADQAVLIRDDSDFDLDSVEDLGGLVVGAQSGTTGEGELEDLIDDGIVDEDDSRQYENYTLGVQDLENGNVDALILDVPVAETFADSRSVVVAFTIETGEEYGFGLRQDDDRIDDLNAALEEIQEDGTYDDLVTEWFE